MCVSYNCICILGRRHPGTRPAQPRSEAKTVINEIELIKKREKHKSRDSTSGEKTLGTGILCSRILSFCHFRCQGHNLMITKERNVITKITKDRKTSCNYK